MAGISEEIAFRELPISYLTRQWREEKYLPIIVLIPGVSFGLVHLTNAVASGRLFDTIMQCILTGKGDYTGQVKASYKILRAANPMKVRMKPVKVRFSRLKRNILVIKRTKAFIVKKAKGKVIFRKKSGSKNIRIDKNTGKIIIRKKTPKKRYKIKVKVIAAGTKNYRRSSKTVLLKVRVK